MESCTKIMSLGYVAMNKPTGSNLIEVCPIEHLHRLDGEITTDTVEVSSCGIDKEGTPYTVSINMGTTVPCTWYGETNHMLSPDVRRGEQVWIWAMGDSNQYYWMSAGRDDHLRRLETQRYRWSGLPDNIDEEINEGNSYYMEISTHKKTVTFKTSMRNGERAGYTMQFNTGDGQVTLVDNEKNIFQLDTANTHIWMENSRGSIVELNKQNIRAWNPGNCEVWLKDKDIFVHNGNGVKVELGGPNLTTTAPGTHTLNAAAFIVNAPTKHNKPVVGGTATYSKINAGSISAGKISVGILVAGKFNYPKP